MTEPVNATYDALMSKRILLYGAGGHGKVVLDAINSNEGCTVAGFVDDSKTGTHMGVPVLGNGDALASLQEQADEVFVCIGNNTERGRIIRQLQKHHIPIGITIHASATVSPLASLAPGCLVLAQASVGPDAKLDTGCIVNTGATVDHDCALEECVHLSPGVHLAGNTHVGAYSHIGIGSCTIEDVRIGKHTVIGAGSVVVRDIPSNCTAYGCPAKPQ